MVFFWVVLGCQGCAPIKSDERPALQYLIPIIEQIRCRGAIYRAPTCSMQSCTTILSSTSISTLLPLFQKVVLPSL